MKKVIYSALLVAALVSPNLARAELSNRAQNTIGLGAAGCAVGATIGGMVTTIGNRGDIRRFVDGMPVGCGLGAALAGGVTYAVSAELPAATVEQLNEVENGAGEEGGPQLAE